MRLKSYFAATVGAAMAKAAQELGPEAMLVHSKESAPETRQLGKYEVVFASPAGAGGAKPPKPAGQNVSETDGTLALVSSLERQLAALRRRLRSTTAPSVAQAAEPAFSEDPEAAFWRAQLGESGLDAEHARQLVDRAAQFAPGKPLADRVRHMLQEWVPIQPGLAGPPASPQSSAPRGSQVIALVGPPGAGKTLTLIKIAVQHGMFVQRPVRLVSLDAMRVGYGMVRADALRAYAGILGADFSLAESVHALARALAGPGDRRLILVDTPGWPRADLAGAKLLAGFLRERPGVDIHLVLPADLSAAALAAAAERFALFRPHKLILTRLDEASSIGAGCSLAARLRIPLSFLADGQSVQDDLRVATHAEIVARLTLDVAEKKPPRRPEAA